MDSFIGTLLPKVSPHLRKFLFILLLDIGVVLEQDKPRGILLDFYYAFPSRAEHQYKCDFKQLEDPFNPPECKFRAGTKKYTEASDVYNFAQLLFYVCLHFNNFTKDEIEKLWQKGCVDCLPLSFSSHIKELLARSFNKDPRQRPTAKGFSRYLGVTNEIADILNVLQYELTNCDPSVKYFRVRQWLETWIRKCGDNTNIIGLYQHVDNKYGSTKVRNINNI